MRLYLDDDSIATVLVRLLTKAGHEVVLPADVGLSGAEDAAHLRQAIQAQRVCLTGNHHDLRLLHEPIIEARGHHPGILVVRRDNDPKRDLSPRGVVRALGNLIAAGVPIVDQLHVLNHWR